MSLPRTKNPVDQIVSLWLEVGRGMRCRMMRVVREEGVNPLYFHALLIVQEHPGMSLGEFAHHLLITSPSATSLVKRLVGLGYLQSTTSAKSRRMISLRLSPKGKKMLATTMRGQAKAMRDVLQQLSSADRRDCSRVLSSLARVLTSASDAH